MQIYNEEHFDWPYDEALKWMSLAFTKVKAFPQKIFVAYGSHKERVITKGRNQEMNVLDEKNLSKDIVIRQIERGGGLTAHEPGQLILYPVLDIEHHGLTIPTLVELVAETMVEFLADIGIKSLNLGQGIFVKEKKIGFLGLRVKDGITSHGLSINLFNNAEIFSLFDPCGIKDLLVTSARCHIMLPKSIEDYGAMLKDRFVKKLLSALKTP